ncbi:MAG: UDP-N-acetylmuramate dehydrogenase [bacterium]|nr:UDP-N-acetylmuramate dehydrogenase [bacterium]
MAVADFIQHSVPLKSLTWMKVGGFADYYAEIRTKEELRKAFEFASDRKLPIVYLGQGSNMILPDEGIRGLILKLMNDQVEVDVNYSAELAAVNVGGGMVLARLIRDCRKQSLNGLDNFVGIPGTVGAAVRGNIGIPEEEFGELVRQVEIFDGQKFRILQPEECEFVYRGSRIKDQYWLVWSVELMVRKGDPPHQDEWLLERVTKQPKGHSCGSFFKNPDPEKGVFAGRVIEECGLKGKKIGGAFVSEKHANFLMNDGTGSAAEILELARKVKQTVKEQKGIELENEVLMYDERRGLIRL